MSNPQAFANSMEPMGPMEPLRPEEEDLVEAVDEPVDGTFPTDTSRDRPERRGDDAVEDRG